MQQICAGKLPCRGPPPKEVLPMMTSSDTDTSAVPECETETPSAAGHERKVCTQTHWTQKGVYKGRTRPSPSMLFSTLEDICIRSVLTVLAQGLRMFAM